MKIARTLSGSLLAAALLLLAGCVPLGNKTHDPELLNDKVLQQRVAAALQRGGPGFGQVRVTVDNGTATLTGTISGTDLRERADEIVRGIYGVKGVRDDMREGDAAR